MVHVDDPATWPQAIRRHIEKLGSGLEGTTQYVLDLGLSLEDDEVFRDLLNGNLIRAYHATRLLDHEVLRIQQTGLLPLSAELVGERIEAAYKYSAITSDERAKLLAGHVFATNEQKHRKGQVSLFVGQHPMKSDPDLLWPLLTTWGGEGIYMSSGTTDLRDRLESLGTPAIVVVDVDLGSRSPMSNSFPPLIKLFVGRILELPRISSDVFYKAPVPASQVAAIWQPGDPEYGAFPDLPQE